MHEVGKLAKELNRQNGILEEMLSKGMISEYLKDVEAVSLESSKSVIDLIDRYNYQVWKWWMHDAIAEDMRKIVELQKDAKWWAESLESSYKYAKGLIEGAKEVDVPVNPGFIKFVKDYEEDKSNENHRFREKGQRCALLSRR